ncbi:MAG: DUF4382 domain-containing protein [Caldisphaera sp.]
MKNLSKGIVAGVLIIVIVLAIGLYYYESYGYARFYISDPGNNSYAQIYLTISSIMIHSTNKGWITVSNKTQTIALSSTPQLLTSTTIPSGNYTEVRFVVESVTIQLLNNINVSANLPSNVFKIAIPGGLLISPGRTTYVTISLGSHITETGNGEYILRPLIAVTTSNSPPS